MAEATGAQFPAVGTTLDHCTQNEFVRLIEAVNPASIVFVIESRMGEVLRSRTTAEDLWQETLFSAWKDRDSCVWQDLKSFRRWLLQIAQNRLLNTADREGAGKRTPSAEESPPPDNDDGASSTPLAWEPVGSTTPSRVAMLRERAQAIRAALDRLDPELRDVVRMRHFEELSNAEVAAALGLGLSAVKHRYRRGAAQYTAILRDVLKSRSHFAPGG